MNEKEKPKEMTLEGIKKIIEASGYSLEIEIADILRKNGWAVFHQYPYFEKTAKKVRLVDILAIKPLTPRLPGLGVSLLIECKKSVKHGWAFHTIRKIGESQSVIALYSDFITKLTKLKKHEVFADVDAEKLVLQFKGFHLAIPETRVGTLCCIPPGQKDDFHKAAYGVLNAMESLEDEMRTQIVFPVIVFEGTMWEFHRNQQLEVGEIEYLNYISVTPNGETVVLFDIVNSSHFADFLKLVDGTLEWLSKNIVPKEVKKLNE